MKDVEQIANNEFKNVPDDGLFPNHTDKDIWIAGFKAGYAYAAPDLLEALEEVVRISDRNHVAWDKAKEAINKAYGL